MKETNIYKLMILAVHKITGVRLFRNNVGTGWVGNKTFTLKSGQTYRAAGGERVIMNPRPLRAGLQAGSGDAIGWRTIVITPDMVGQKIAQFTSVETKTAKGPTREAQEKWEKAVNNHGGLAVIVRSPEDAVEALIKSPTEVG